MTKKEINYMQQAEKFVVSHFKEYDVYRYIDRIEMRA